MDVPRHRHAIYRWAAVLILLVAVEVWTVHWCLEGYQTWQAADRLLVRLDRYGLGDRGYDAMAAEIEARLDLAARAFTLSGAGIVASLGLYAYILAGGVLPWMRSRRARSHACPTR